MATTTPDHSKKSVRGLQYQKRRTRRRIIMWTAWTALVILIVVSAIAWLGFKATTIRAELRASTVLIPELKAAIASEDAAGATRIVDDLMRHTSEAREATEDPLWKIASALPGVGENFQAASVIATSADDAARLGAAPLVGVFQSLDWKTFTPSPEGIDLAPLKAAAPKVQAAAHAVHESSQRLNTLDADSLMPEISRPLVEARNQLGLLSESLDSAASTASLAPDMMGSSTPRRYLLLMQNNAESRATGGIPGALAVLNVDKGSLTLEAQTSATALGAFIPPVAIDSEQQAIYSNRIGKFMQDVNLTPDFPTTASTAQAMWERSTGERLDGVLSLDPVALSFILDATGPIQIEDPTIRQIGSNLPSQLTAMNVVQTLLSDAYAKIEEPELQDIYFAGAAKEIFAAVSSKNTDPKKLLDAIARGVDERRILLWSASTNEQRTISQYSLGGLTSGSTISPTQFGVYFNDGTGAKMDFWVKRTVQVARDCTRDGYREVTLRVTSTNTAPNDAAAALPSYVTGGGAFGVPSGSVQTNVVAYGPFQSDIDTVVKDGLKIPFAAQRHNQRPVGTSTIRLAPGQSTSLEFNFGHIVQDSAPDIAVTPTTQPVKDVIQTTTPSSCER
ncbi:DUF4012 domain-containing protein [Paenarthrobacter nitroguajacolicus]|uniref:DUF4012 domain-containing protein n=1 Tax=Paenarthrobacter nitroguajacolicus TaxID=211146 RepID=UPI003AE0B3D1